MFRDLLKETAKIKEGTWSLPKTPAQRQTAENAISEIERLKTKLHDICGDDTLFDALDTAQSRIKELLKEKEAKNV
jgi:hypothetical protein